MNQEKKKLERSVGSLVFVGCLMLGVGIGFIQHAVHIGAVIGLGAGFIAMAAVFAFYRAK